MPNVYSEEDLEKECVCECCEIDQSVFLGVIKKDNVTVLAHLCLNCEMLCRDLFAYIETIRKTVLTK